MSETVEVTGRSAGRGLLASAGLVWLVSVATGGLVVVPWLPPLDLAVGLAVPLALLLGPTTAPGVAAGLLLGAATGPVLGAATGPVLGAATGLVPGPSARSLSWLTAVDALSGSVLAYSGYRLWGVLPAVASGEDPRLRSVEQWIEFVAVAALAGATGVAVLAWATLVAWGGLFHAIVLREFSIVVVSTLLVGPAVIYPAGKILHGGPAGYADRTPLETGSGGFRGCVVAPLLWIVVGSTVSLAIGLAQLVGVQTFVRHGFRNLVVLFDPAVVGDGGRRVLVVFGALVLSLIAATYAPLTLDAATDRPDGVAGDS